MNAQRPCPNREQLVDLLDGRLLEPDLSDLADHVEHCTKCQALISQLEAQDTLTKVLQGRPSKVDSESTESTDRIMNRLKQIPMLAADRSHGPGQLSQSSASEHESVNDASDSTHTNMGQLGPYRILKLLGPAVWAQSFWLKTPNWDAMWP